MTDQKEPRISIHGVERWTQPTPVTCIQTCLAMAIGATPNEVIIRWGGDAKNGDWLLSALDQCGVIHNRLLGGKMVFPGWYFACVPSLNKRGGMHQILINWDEDTGKVTVFDPAIGETYKQDGSDLVSWEDLIAFKPGGKMPGIPALESANARIAELEKDKAEKTTARLDALNYVLSVVVGRRALERHPAYFACVSEIELFIKAAIERLTNGEPMNCISIAVDAEQSTGAAIAAEKGQNHE